MLTALSVRHEMRVQEWMDDRRKKRQAEFDAHRFGVCPLPTIYEETATQLGKAEHEDLKQHVYLNYAFADDDDDLDYVSDETEDYEEYEYFGNSEMSSSTMDDNLNDFNDTEESDHETKLKMLNELNSLSEL